MSRIISNADHTHNPDHAQSAGHALSDGAKRRRSLDAAGDVVLLARATLTNIRQDLFFAFVCIVLATPLGIDSQLKRTGRIADQRSANTRDAFSFVSAFFQAFANR